MQYVIVNPYEHPNNDYIRLQIEAIRRAGYTPVPQTGNIVKSDCILYNWMENVDGNHKALIIAKKLVRLIQFKVLGKRIVWVMHNKQPHENSYKFGLFMNKIFKNLIYYLINVYCWLSMIPKLFRQDFMEARLEQMPELKSCF